MAFQIDIVDHNSFGNVLLSRTFTDAVLAQDWAAAQVAYIIESMKENGEDLLDIEYKLYDMTIDDDRIDQRRWIRS